MKFKVLLDRWKKEAAPARTVKEYAIRLNLDDAARLHALAELFPERRIEELIADLLHAGLDEVAAAMPYVAGPRVISRDDHGDPAYEDVGMTPRFVELTRRFKKELQAAPAMAATGPVPGAAAAAPAAAPTAAPAPNPLKSP
ncbi:MAG TPA: pilin assembly protein [Steroidobacteraceae bacterium]|nr:pilin assembly protein [Steroidobacteraceae bacterium]